MKKLSALLLLVCAVILSLLSACRSDPEQAVKKDMLKCGTFSYDLDDDDSHDFKLTFNKDYTYSLYIKDYEYSYQEVKMKTYTGKWSSVFTYEYEYDTHISHLAICSKTKNAILGIYLLEGYTYTRKTSNSDGIEELGYFGYEKSTGKGTLFTTDKPIDEQFLKSCRKPSYAHIASNLGPVELPGFMFEKIDN